MPRTWRDPRCPDCRERPQATYTGSGWKFLCACGKEFSNPEAGIEATGVEAECLASKGFRLAHSDNKDTYYEGTEHRLIWLWADGTFYVDDPFSGDNGSKGTLEEYLDRIPGRVA